MRSTEVEWLESNNAGGGDKIGGQVSKMLISRGLE